MNSKNRFFKARRTKIGAGILVLSLLGLIARITQSEQLPTLAAYLPQGALVYIETPDFANLIGWWKNSDLREQWQTTANYRQFVNSRLYLKLRDRIGKLGDVDSFQFNLEDIARISGSRSALALYDIGELKAIAITHTSFAQASATKLWQTHAKFSSRTASPYTYYIEPNNGNLAFAYAEPYLIVSTEENLLLKTLSAFQNKETPKDTLDQTEKWRLCQSLQPQRSTLFLYVDQENLNQNRYFRRYWIHKNVKDLAGIRAVWIDVSVTREAITEHRYYVWNDKKFDQGGSEQGALGQYLNALAQVKHEYLSIKAPPDPEEIAHHMLTVFNKFPQRFEKTSYPPTYSAAFARANQAETKNVYLQNVDDVQSQGPNTKILAIDQYEKIVQALQDGKPQLQIRLAYPLWDDLALFVDFPQTLLVRFGNFDAIDQQTTLSLLQSYFRTLASAGEEGSSWNKTADGDLVLAGFNPVYIRLQSPWILISNRADSFQEARKLLQLPEIAWQGNYVDIDSQNGRWKYSRLMKRLDFGFATDTPLFFSQNIDSLLSTLAKVSAVRIKRAGNEEVITYHLQP
jgi:hypothetical protein